VTTPNISGPITADRWALDDGFPVVAVCAADVSVVAFQHGETATLLVEVEHTGRPPRITLADEPYPPYAGPPAPDYDLAVAWPLIAEVVSPHEARILGAGHATVTVTQPPAGTGAAIVAVTTNGTHAHISTLTPYVGPPPVETTRPGASPAWRPTSGQAMSTRVGRRAGETGARTERVMTVGCTTTLSSAEIAVALIRGAGARRGRHRGRRRPGTRPGGGVDRHRDPRPGRLPMGHRPRPGRGGPGRAVGRGRGPPAVACPG